MSRIAKNPITVPTGVTVDMQGEQVTVKGTKGVLHYTVPAAVIVTREDNVVHVKMQGAELNQARARAVKTDLAGTVHANISNMVKGVVTGFDCSLELLGVGYRAQAQGKTLQLTLGFSHPVVYDIPAGITIETPSQTEIVIKGIDKRLVGQVAAEIRGYRPPEPYKGKGVRYKGEVIKLKETKKK